MVYYFLEGGAFMWPILLTLLFGLAFVIERAYSLMMSAVDSQTFFESVSQSIKESGTDAAVQVCSETEGPVASIFHAGLSKMSRGLDEVEKAIQNAGAIEMAFLEKNMILALEPSIEIENDLMLVHEENILITQNGNRLLTSRTPKELPVINV